MPCSRPKDECPVSPGLDHHQARGEFSARSTCSHVLLRASERSHFFRLCDCQTAVEPGCEVKEHAREIHMCRFRRYEESTQSTGLGLLRDTAALCRTEAFTGGCWPHSGVRCIQCQSCVLCERISIDLSAAIRCSMLDSAGPVNPLQSPTTPTESGGVWLDHGCLPRGGILPAQQKRGKWSGGTGKRTLGSLRVV